MADMSQGDLERPMKEPLWPPVAGIMLWDVPFWFDNRRPMRQKVLGEYYGSAEEAVWGVGASYFESLPA